VVSKKPALDAQGGAHREGPKAAQSKGGKVEAPKAEAPKPEAAARRNGQAEAAHTSAFDERSRRRRWESAKEAVKRVGDKAHALEEAGLGGSNAAAIAATPRPTTRPHVRKAARRALNVLKARGIAVPSKPHVARPSSEA
jgi:hypothetical protein